VAQPRPDAVVQHCALSWSTILGEMLDRWGEAEEHQFMLDDLALEAPS